MLPGFFMLMGFHEGRLDIENVKENAQDIEELVNLVEIAIDKVK